MEGAGQKVEYKEGVKAKGVRECLEIGRALESWVPGQGTLDLNNCIAGEFIWVHEEG